MTSIASSRTIVACTVIIIRIMGIGALVTDTIINTENIVVGPGIRVTVMPMSSSF